MNLTCRLKFPFCCACEHVDGVQYIRWQTLHTECQLQVLAQSAQSCRRETAKRHVPVNELNVADARRCGRYLSAV